MNKSNSFENALLLLLFNNTNIANLGDATGVRGSTAAGSLYLSLHTADPGEAGSQTTNEATYTGYARKSVARSGAGWTVSGNQVTNAAAVTFDPATAGSNIITHFGIGTELSGAGTLLYKAPLGTAIQGPFTAKVDNTITIPGHTLAVNETVQFFPVQGSSLPTGITEGTNYFVLSVTGDDITISATQGGSVIDITAVGDGIAVETATLTVSAGITPEFGIGQIVLTED